MIYLTFNEKHQILKFNLKCDSMVVQNLEKQRLKLNLKSDCFKLLSKSEYFEENGDKDVLKADDNTILVQAKSFKDLDEIIEVAFKGFQPIGYDNKNKQINGLFNKYDQNAYKYEIDIDYKIRIIRFFNVDRAATP